ncbi:probable DNA mismatch repair protein Msh6 [Orussus abietinus]|uniref:probable DNA mismatch repair protein Msh6 n=1 Tax=Orussus abietinus TaxID=222816 RepID=UPI000626E505|nr:probable DNA mismatch repair protein Msh6 [Orussus abietinus]
MSKVNTLYNYFTSPKTAKPNNGATTPAKSKSATPKREQKNKGRKIIEGKENVISTERKRSIEDDEDEGPSPVKPKKRRIIIPEDSEDSEDEFKPGSEEELESESASEGVSEDEPETASDEESPKKKVKISKTPASSAKRDNKIQKPKGKKESKPTLAPQEPGITAAPIISESWPHLKYDFLQPNKIKDINQRPASDPDYNPRTVYVPVNFLNNQTPAMRQWWELKSKHFDCVLFFKVGKFYELYHMDAVTGVNELSLSYMRGEFAHSGFPEIAYGRFSASLIEKGYKVARIEQTENPDMMARRCGKIVKVTKFDKVVKREICQISTRGTRVYTPQDAEASTPNSNYLLALVEKCYSGVPSFGVCFLDTTIGEFYLGQFEDDRCNSRLLTLLAHHPPAHIVYERGNLSQHTMKILNTLSSVTIKEPLQRESQFWSGLTTLKKLHEGDYFKKEGDSNFSWPEGIRGYLSEGDSLGLTPAEDKELAIHALGGCVYLLKEYLLDQQLLAQGRFKTYVPPDYNNNQSNHSMILANNMVLDAITINNLRVLTGEGSLISTIDRCCTAFGKRLLRDWVCKPSCRKAIITERQEAVSELLDRSDVVQDARAILGSLPDLERLLSKIHAQGNAVKMTNHPDGRAIMFEGQTYSKRKILDFTTTLDGFEEILKLIALFSDFNTALLHRYTRLEPEGDFPNLRKTLDYFKTAFDHEEAKKEGCIVPKEGVDSEYDSVLQELAEIKSDLNDYLAKQRRHFGVKVTLHGTDRKRYQIEVPETQMKKVGPGYELQSQRKGYKRYYTAEAKELLSRQINAEEHRDKVLKDLNRRIFAKFSEMYDMWSSAVHKVASLDVLIAFAEYTRSGDMCVPEIHEVTENGEVFIDIKEGKHPCIMSDNFIPNDTVLGITECAPLMILTGPNMGGKSTLMRQVGLLTIMAQIGCHVPASSCRLTLVDRIFTRLGANDDILAGQSTFFVELSETATILHHATPNSLVLLDELGRGTSTYDGTAIAAAVVGALTKLRCRTLFSTHYHSLVEDYKTNENVTLAHMACMVEKEEEEEVSQETVTFLYKLSGGACPKSYGFNAARLAGIPPKITKRAHEISSNLERETNQKHIFTELCKLDESSIKSLIAAF